MGNAQATNRGRGRPSRARILIAGLVLAGAASVAPMGTTAPAGAWGSKSIGCTGTGASGLSGGSAVATTTGSNCGSNQVRWNFYWGPGVWKKVAGSTANIVENPHLYAGGGRHRACDGCTIVNT